MKITLIEPKSPGVHVFNKVKLPRLGLPIMATILKQKGYDVEVQAEEIRSLNFDRIYNSDLVGLSTITSTAPRAYHLADKIKNQVDIPIVIGGSHVTFYPEEALSHADFCVMGEGEKSFLELVEFIDTQKDSGKKPENIPGLAYFNENKELIKNSLPDPVTHNDLPFPDLSLIAGSEKMNILPMETSRGCPFGCKFCSVIKMFGKKYRFKHIDKVADELARLSPAKIFFYDDNFAADRERTYQLMKKIISRRDINIQWGAQVRADIYKDPELLDIMKEAGGRMLHIGFESVNQSTLEEYNKSLSIDETKQAIKTIKDKGFHIHGMFVIGSDHDDVRTAHETVNFALKHKIDTIQLLILVPIPGSEQFHELASQNRLLPSSWEYYDGHHVVHRPENISPYELQYQVMKEMTRFYSFKKCLELAAKFKFINLYFRFYGFRTLRQWFKDRKNISYLEFLKKKYSPDVTMNTQ
ncbi:B12-binding domain-containing radical SAM protein [Natranaerobius thermophilus]|uniref:Radical SAM domain protein n=1 Tax=Natranaerobius thermophilus (strain ATCC BAA-1301 / DSM 18059 / JW/NM-WN-LF) TaxID=457570 RepID=B2A770_NATTJ|nr:radical SAM protein [Natranaerobius thermophilus]ACB84264.1 Radical SAM domain protein [Natranaerobius thermophilus JW/NM-WN-LF]